MDDVQLHAANTSVQVAHLHIFPNGTGLESINRTISQPSVRVRRSAFCASIAEGIGENIDRTPAIGIRQRQASNLADAG